MELDEGRCMLEEIFDEILDSPDFDYIIKTQILIRIKPEGW
jgi:hypothetical protein